MTSEEKQTPKNAGMAYNSSRRRLDTPGEISSQKIPKKA